MTITNNDMQDRQQFLTSALHFYVLISMLSQPSPSDVQVQASSGKKNLGFHQAETKGRSSPDLNSSPGSSLSPSSPSSSTPVSRRLSSPEKIISLHEQLQKTLMSSSQVTCAEDVNTTLTNCSC